MAKTLKRTGPLKRLRKAGTKKPTAAKAAKPTADMEAYMSQMLSLKARGRVGAGAKAPAKKKKYALLGTQAKRLRRKAKPKSKPKAKPKKKRRVALVATKRPAATGAFTLPLGGRPSTKGWRTYATSVGGLESKYGGAVDLAPDLGF